MQEIRFNNAYPNLDLSNKLLVEILSSVKFQTKKLFKTKKGQYLTAR